MIKRSLKWLTWLLLGIILLVLLLVAFVWYTETGTRWAVNQALDSAPDKLTVGSVTGTLSDSVTLSKLRYEQPGIKLQVAEFSWRLKSLSPLTPAIVLESIAVNNPALTIDPAAMPEPDPDAEPFTGVDLPLAVTIESLRMSNLKISTGETTEIIDSVALAITGAGDQIEFNDLKLVRQQLTLEGKGGLTLSEQLPFNFEHSWSWLQQGNRFSGSGLAEGSLQQISLDESLQVAAPGEAVGEVELVASADLAKDDPTIDASITTDQLYLVIPATQAESSNQSRADSNASGQQQPIRVAINNFSAEVAGTLSSWTLQSAGKLAAEHYPEVIFELAGSGSDTQAEVSALTINTLEGEITGTAAASWQNALDIKAKLLINNINPEGLDQEWAGSLGGSIEASFLAPDSGGYQITVEKAALEGELKQQQFVLEASGSAAPDNISLQPSVLKLGDNEVSASGELIGEQVSGEFKADISDFSEVLAGATGQLNATGSVTGTLDIPNIEAEIAGENLKFETYKVADLSGNGSYQNLRWQGQLAAADISIDGYELKTVKATSQGELESHRLNLTVANSDLDTQLELTGGWLDQRWQGQLRSHEITVPAVEARWALTEPADIKVSDQGLMFSRSCWQRAGHSDKACTRVDYQNLPTAKLDGAFRLEALDVESFASVMPPQLDLSGVISGRGTVDWQPGALNVDALVEMEGGEFTYTPPASEEAQQDGASKSLKPYTSQIELARLTATQAQNDTQAQLALRLSDGSYLDATLDLQDVVGEVFGLDGTIKAEFNRTLYFAALTPEIESIEGNLNLTGSVSGTSAEPILNLQGSLPEGKISLLRTGTSLSEINFAIEQQSAGAMTLQASAKSGEGDINLEGDLQLADWNDWQLSAIISGENFRLLRLPELGLDISPELQFEGTNERIEITGDLRIPYGEVNLKELPPSAVTASDDVVVHDSKRLTKTTAGPAVVFDINATIDDKIDFNALGLEAEIVGQLNVSKTAVRSTIFGNGRLQVNNGKYSIYGQTLDIDRGELLFNGPIDNPQLDILASRESISGDVKAGIRLGGTVNNLRSELYSEPALRDAEVLSYLLTGRGLGEGGGADGNQLAQAAILLGLKRSAPLLSEIQSNLGIDVLTINDSKGSDSSAVEAGKYISEDFYVGYAYGLFNRTGFWLIRYQLTEALRLESQYGENQSFDLIYSIEKP